MIGLCRRGRSTAARRSILLLFVIGLARSTPAAEELNVTDATWISISDYEQWDPVDLGESPSGAPIREAAFFQPQPLVAPEITIQPTTTTPAGARQLTAQLFGTRGNQRSLLAQRRRSITKKPGVDYVLGRESKVRSTTDGGSLLKKSPSVLGVGVQRRTPIVSDPRVRGSRVGALAASGSHWVPARIDLDTMLSKIDSRIVSDMIVMGGPFSTRYGPGFKFVEVDFLPTPRFEDGPEWHGTSSLDYHTNGEQWYARQSLTGGGEDWGVRFGYGHRTGSDYRTGNGDRTAASYNSRQFDLTLGKDLTEDSSIEMTILRLDQTGVEFPGYAFDIDFLVTDGYEVTYVLNDQEAFDRLEVEAWYNRTRFAGNAQSAPKRRQFPIFDFIQYQGFTDVDSTSTGFRAETTWGADGECCPQLSAGVDLRFVKQELNEISSGVTLGIPFPFSNRNSPIPNSYSVDPGVYFEFDQPVSDQLSFTCGARADFAKSKIDEDPNKLAQVGLVTPPPSYAEVVGFNQFEQNFTMGAGFLTGEYLVNDRWTLQGGFGYAERQPTLTELYAAQSFMFLLQNGLNTVTGDPRLKPERNYQIDLSLKYDDGITRFGARGYHSWLRDYITFENLRAQIGPPIGAIEQVSLKYVNTDLATMAGFELYGETNLTQTLTPFATMSFVEGRDQTRNGSFATTQATAGNPSARVPGQSRGAFSGVAGGAKEPLPGIIPLQGTVGIRLHEPSNQPSWSLEIAARIVDDQNRIAASLVESPTPGFAVGDIRGFWQYRDGMLLVAGVENFTDRTYREHLDFRAPNGIAVFQPGVNFYFGTELNY